MKVYDKTPFQDQQGNINIISRIQGTLKYGMNWYPELQAQKPVISQLNRLLDKGFVLIRSFTLPDSDIIIPMILIGPGSLSVILVTPVKGHFEAKGTEWNTVTNGVSMPARRNLIDLISKLARALQRYMQLNNINIPVQIEPVLIASDPGANIESMRPVVRVVRSDAIKQFVNTLHQASPVLRAEQVLALADLILEPHPAKSTEKLAESETTTAGNLLQKQPTRKESKSTESVKFSSKTGAKPTPKPAKKNQPTLKGWQIALLAGMGILACCILVAAAYFASTILVG